MIGAFPTAGTEHAVELLTHPDAPRGLAQAAHEFVGSATDLFGRAARLGILCRGYGVAGVGPAVKAELDYFREAARVAALAKALLAHEQYVFISALEALSDRATTRNLSRVLRARAAIDGAAWTYGVSGGTFKGPLPCSNPLYGPATFGAWGRRNGGPMLNDKGLRTIAAADPFRELSWWLSPQLVG